MISASHSRADICALMNTAKRMAPTMLHLGAIRDHPAAYLRRAFRSRTWQSHHLIMSTMWRRRVTGVTISCSKLLADKSRVSAFSLLAVLLLTRQGNAEPLEYIGKTDRRHSRV